MKRNQDNPTAGSYNAPTTTSCSKKGRHLKKSPSNKKNMCACVYIYKGIMDKLINTRSDAIMVLLRWDKA